MNERPGYVLGETRVRVESDMGDLGMCLVVKEETRVCVESDMGDFGYVLSVWGERHIE